MKRLAALALTLTLAALALGCATAFSPAVVRSEIARQTGADPSSMLEVNLGPVTLAVARTVIGPAADGALPLQGLARFELAVYGVPATERRLDFTRMEVRGWEPTVRVMNERGSTVVLLRRSGELIGDLVLLAADRDQALYTRLSGRLARELPVALAEAVEKRGTNSIKQELLSLSEAPVPTPAITP